jgi:hypothetical protein
MTEASLDPFGSSPIRDASLQSPCIHWGCVMGQVGRIHMFCKLLLPFFDIQHAYQVSTRLGRPLSRCERWGRCIAILGNLMWGLSLKPFGDKFLKIFFFVLLKMKTIVFSFVFSSEPILCRSSSKYSYKKTRKSVIHITREKRRWAYIIQRT